MILRMPEYCKDFRCIADKCKDNCCIGWEIDIDPETAEFYSHVKGEFGQELKENIKNEEEVFSFVLKGERCPFLNDSNLCEIIINLREEQLCQICTDHPRYYEWFDGVKEGGIGLCCEEAARIILSQTAPLSFWDRAINDDGFDEYDIELYDYLIKCRKTIIRVLEDKSVGFENCLSAVIEFCKNVQKNIETFNYTIPTVNFDNYIFKPNIIGIMKTLLTLEPMDKNWKPLIEKVINDYDKINCNPFISADTEIYLRNIAIYFVWRYFMKAVFDEDVISKMNLTVVSITVIAYLFEHHRFIKGELTLEDCAMLAKAYSKEIEYSEENCKAVQFGIG